MNGSVPGRCWLETRLSKNEILKLYLDRAYMGGGAFGVDAAAQFYFGKSAREVNLAEAAMLAGLFKAPTRFAPHINLPAARARANVVLDNLVEAGLMTEGHVFGARRNPATAIDRRDEGAPGYYLDYAFDEMKKLVETFPRNISDRSFVVRTALDLGLQHAAEDAVENSIRRFGRDYHAKQAATVVADLDGAVRAMVGGLDYNTSQFNRATDAMRQPGSSFKPYVYATALANGYKPTTTVVDVAWLLPRQLVPAELRPKLFGHRHAAPGNHALDQRGAGEAVDHGRATEIRQGRPRQDHRDGARAWASSRRCPTPPRCRSAPMKSTCSSTRSPMQPSPTRARRWTPHAAARASVPAPARTILALRPRRQETRPGADPAGRLEMAVMMSKVVEEGTANRAQLDGIKAAGKTGTTNSYRDAWFVGYTGNFVCGVWFGNDDYSPLNRMTGGSLPAQTWHEIMAYAHQGIELKTVAGIGPNPVATGPILDKEGKDLPIRPAMLTNKGMQALLHVEQMMAEVSRSMVASTAPGTAAATPATTGTPPVLAAAKTPPAPRATAPGRADKRVGSVANVEERRRQVDVIAAEDAFALVRMFLSGDTDILIEPHPTSLRRERLRSATLPEDGEG